MSLEVGVLAIFAASMLMWLGGWVALIFGSTAICATLFLLAAVGVLTVVGVIVWDVFFA